MVGEAPKKKEKGRKAEVAPCWFLMIFLENSAITLP